MTFFVICPMGASLKKLECSQGFKPYESSKATTLFFILKSFHLYKLMINLSIKDISLNKISLPYLTEKNIKASVLRLDEVHPIISGNKWFKLKCYLSDATKGFKKVVVTFGGAYSNHIIATAAACSVQNLQSIGIIRGERAKNLSHTLEAAAAFGMELFFVSREDYQQKKIPQTVFKQYEKESLYFINEGGYGITGAEGAASILNGIDENQYSHIMAAVGTGTTLAGLTTAASNSKVIGISALKGNFSIEDEINQLLLPNKKNQFTLLHQYHFGGYAKKNKDLFNFMNEWYNTTGIPSDFVYTAKLFYAFQDLCLQDYFTAGSHILLIHSGGLQGNLSLPKETLIF